MPRIHQRMTYAERTLHRQGTAILRGPKKTLKPAPAYVPPMAVNAFGMQLTLEQRLDLVRQSQANVAWENAK